MFCVLYVACRLIVINKNDDNDDDDDDDKNDAKNWRAQLA